MRKHLTLMTKVVMVVMIPASYVGCLIIHAVAEQQDPTKFFGIELLFAVIVGAAYYHENHDLRTIFRGEQ